MDYLVEHEVIMIDKTASFIGGRMKVDRNQIDSVLCNSMLLSFLKFEVGYYFKDMQNYMLSFCFPVFRDLHDYKLKQL